MSLGIQKAPVWKRASAFLFDIMLVISLSLVFLIGFSAFLNFDKYSDTLTAKLTSYEQKYEVPVYTDEEYESLTEEQKSEFGALQELALTAFFQDELVGDTITELVMVVVAAGSVSILLAYVVVFFLVPQIFKNGQTLGKKSFGLAVMRTHGVKVSNPVLFIRTVMGMFVIETLFPLLLLALTVVGFLGSIGIMTPILLLVLDLGVMIYTPTNSTIHDLLCDTVVVDMASQEIFDTEEELLAYKQRLAAQKAAEQEGQTA